VQVTLLYFDDCPNWRVAAEHLRPLAWENPEIEVSHRLVETIEEAEETTFRGSPSFIVGGVDVFADADVPVGLACHVYQAPDGPAGSPTIGQSRDVVSRM
jgi:hypothetical protein